MSKHMELTTMQWVSSLVCTAWNLFISKNQQIKGSHQTAEITPEAFFFYVSLLPALTKEAPSSRSFQN